MAMNAYFFFNVLEVLDAEKMEAYRSRVFAVVARYGGRYRVLAGPCHVVEGDWRPAFPVLIEFPSVEAARRWYDSPDYADLKALRLAATRGEAVFFEPYQPAGDAGAALPADA
jgi:uncharacterized protein (DUF1330 family)